MKQLAVSNSVNPNELIRKLVAGMRPEGGFMFLDDFCGKLPGVPRAECVQAIKNSRNVKFIVGRKGHQSRIVFGNMMDDYHQAPSFRSAMAQTPIHRNNTTRRRQAPANSVVGTALDPSRFQLRLTVQGQTVLVPVENLELVTAE